MPIQIREESEGKVIDIHVLGKLIKQDYRNFVSEFERFVRLHGKLRVLFDMTGFHGWDAGAAWEDIKFDVTHFSDIEKMAMIGEEKWQYVMATFCRPFIKATIRYFDWKEMDAARKWLGETDPVLATVSEPA